MSESHRAVRRDGGLVIPDRELGSVEGADGPTDSEASSAISLDGAQVHYGAVQATGSLSFSVRSGEFVSLIGPSGCGKSSALLAIGGLIPLAQGRVEVNGADVTGPRPEDIAFVFQDLALYPWRSARRNVELALEIAGVPRPVRRERVALALEQVGMSEFADRFPAQLSGGMRQRVALARALVSDAPILLFDEPFAALDEYARTLLGMELLRVLEEQQKTVVFVTHSLAEAAYLSDRILLMSPRPGKISTSIDVALDRPRHREMMKEPAFHALTDRLFSLLYGEPSGGEQG